MRTTELMPAGPACASRTGSGAPTETAGNGNDGTVRRAIWQRLGGDEWSAFDALPAAIRSRISQHAYDAWSVNALVLWRRFRRQHASEARAERALLRYLDHCERLERRAFSSDWRARHGTPFPHDAARASVLRDRADPLRPPPGGDAVSRSQLPRQAGSALCASGAGRHPPYPGARPVTRVRDITWRVTRTPGAG